MMPFLKTAREAQVSLVPYNTVIIVTFFQANATKKSSHSHCAQGSAVIARSIRPITPYSHKNRLKPTTGLFRFGKIVKIVKIGG
jgi:hypothetical protein